LQSNNNFQGYKLNKISRLKWLCDRYSWR